jgi:hypothetical protein
VGATDALLLPYPELTEAADGPNAVSRLANAVEDYFYDRILPVGVTRYATYHWGSGTTFPTAVQGARVGDTYFHTGLGCRMKFDGTAWAQDGVMATPANVAARDAISTNYSALLYPTFRVRVADTGRIWEWTGSFWKYMGLQMVSAYATVDRLVAQSWQLAVCDTVRTDPWGMYNAGLGVFGAPVQGWYRLNGAVAYAASTAGARGAAWQTRANSGAAWAFIPGGGVVAQPSGIQTVMATPTVLFALAAGQQVGLFGYQNSGANLNQIGSVVGQQCGLTIELVEQTA